MSNKLIKHFESDFEIITKGSSENEPFHKVKGTLSSIGNVDREGDKILPGAFDKIIANKSFEIPMLFQHDVGATIGKWVDFQLVGNSLKAIGMILKTLSNVADVLKLIENEIIKGVSIGFLGRGEMAEDRYKDYFCPIDYKEVDLLEASIVSIPCNPEAQLKSNHDFEQSYRRKLYFETIVKGLKVS